MTDSFQKLQDLDLTHDEINKLGEALKKPEFRQLLTDYVVEIQDPDNRKLYEREIIELEKQRGIDATFIHPAPGYVIKTSANGTRKTFINICVNELIAKPQSVASVKENSRGLEWSLPYSLSPPRDDLDHNNVRCQVYDVVFHPDTVHLAANNKSFRQMIDSTACDAIESNFDVALDRNNLKHPKVAYKGLPHASIIRTAMGQVSAQSEEDRKFYEQVFAAASDSSSNHRSCQQGKIPTHDIGKTDCSSGGRNKKVSGGAVENSPPYTLPKYQIKHRSRPEMDEFLENKQAKMNSAIPKELVIEIDLPLLQSSSDINLDVTEKTIQLISEKPAKYKLNLTLPYQVNQDIGSAKFEKDSKRLIVVLPVKRAAYSLGSGLAADRDSGVESDQGSSSVDNTDRHLVVELASSISSSVGEKKKQYNRTVNQNNQFLDKNVLYNLPEFTCHRFDATDTTQLNTTIVAFTLNVKNVDAHSVANIIDHNNHSVYVKFTSIGASYYPTHYAIFLKLSMVPASIAIDQVQIETWDNNVTVQISFVGGVFKSYWYGLDPDTQKFVDFEDNSTSDVPSSTVSINDQNIIEPNVAQETSERELLMIDGTAAGSEAINIVGSLSGRAYESSGDDELSCYGSSKSSSCDVNRGILKRLSSSSSSSVVPQLQQSAPTTNSGYLIADRSISESSLDDFGLSASLSKKTVRFNDVITKQLYRSNSSILGQKKKNQRRAKNKKRANERRHNSESEASEIEDKKEDGDDDDYDEVVARKADQEFGGASDIFHMDLNL